MKKHRFCTAALLGAAVVSCWGGMDSFAAEAVITQDPAARAGDVSCRIPQGLSVGDRSLEGLTLDEALETVSAYVDELLARPVTLTAGESSITAAAGELGVTWSNEEEVTEAVSLYENSNLLKRYMIQEDLKQEPESVPVVTEISAEGVEQFVSGHLSGVGQEAQDAVIVRENGEFIITPEVTGYAVDMEATCQALREALGQGLEQEILVQAVVKETEPEVTAAKLETIQDVLGTFSTDFSSSGAARSTNLSVGAAKINGRVLMPGETLSGYECLQPFTEANGYKAAASYENGQVVDSIGGGVCQISTTLYNASLLAELEITQRQNHSMTVGYVKPSQDAAIAGTYKDIKVTNPYDTPVYIEGYTKGRTITFTIYGQETRPENRSIRFESETLQRIDPGAPKEVLNTSLAPGARVQIQSAHTGLKSRLWKIVTVDGVEQERTIVSSDTYNASPAIIQIGPPVPVVPETQSQTIPEPAAGEGVTGESTGITAGQNPAGEAAGESAAPDVSAAPSAETAGESGAQSGPAAPSAETAAESAGQSGPAIPPAETGTESAGPDASAAPSGEAAASQVAPSPSPEVMQ